MDEVVGGRRTVASHALRLFGLAVLVFLNAPLVVVAVMSVGNPDRFEFPPAELSTTLYARLFADPSWMRALRVSAVVAIAATGLSLALGVPAAYGLLRGRFVGRRLVALFLVSPIMVPTVVIGFSLFLYFSWFRLAGSLAGLILAHTFYALPFVVVTALSGLRHVDQNVERAAAVMGAGPLTVFVRVTLPLLRPAIVVAALLAFLMSFDEVVISLFLVQTATLTLPVKMYGSIQFDTSPLLAAIATLLSAISIAICLAAIAVQRGLAAARPRGAGH